MICYDGKPQHWGFQRRKSTASHRKAWHGTVFASAVLDTLTELGWFCPVTWDMGYGNMASRQAFYVSCNTSAWVKQKLDWDTGKITCQGGNLPLHCCSMAEGFWFLSC